MYFKKKKKKKKNPDKSSHNSTQCADGLAGYEYRENEVMWLASVERSVMVRRPLRV